VWKHLWDPLDQISSWTAQFLFGQMGSISALSQSPAQILLNSNKKFEGILIPPATHFQPSKGGCECVGGSRGAPNPVGVVMDWWRIPPSLGQERVFSLLWLTKHMLLLLIWQGGKRGVMWLDKLVFLYRWQMTYRWKCPKRPRTKSLLN
jgi:hypothetical protein